MAASDWQTVINSLAVASLARGVTAGLTVPNGGGTHLFGWRSLTTGVTGVHAIRADQANFNPIPGNNGGQIQMALQRTVGDPDSMATFGFFQAQNDDVNAGDAYIFGLAAGDPGNIVLRKGTLVGGLPDDIVGDSGILRKSTDTVAVGTWVHLRLDVISNPSGDVILKMFQNDLDANPVTAPVWTAITGMDDFNDDVLGVNSGTPGLAAGGRAGVAFYMTTSGVVGAADHVTIGRET